MVKTILYAEDEESVRNVTSRIIGVRFPDIHLESFTDGTSLVERLEKGVEDVAMVLTDNNMPGINGGMVIKRYARLPEFAQIPFVLNYGGDTNIGEKAIEDGARAYILKPEIPLKVMKDILG